MRENAGYLDIIKRSKDVREQLLYSALTKDQDSFLINWDKLPKKRRSQVLLDLICFNQSISLISMLRECSIEYSLPRDISIKISEQGIGYYKQIKYPPKGIYIVIAGNDSAGSFLCDKGFIRNLLEIGYDVINYHPLKQVIWSTLAKLIKSVNTKIQIS